MSDGGGGGEEPLEIAEYPGVPLNPFTTTEAAVVISIFTFESISYVRDFPSIVINTEYTGEGGGFLGGLGRGGVLGGGLGGGGELGGGLGEGGDDGG